MLDTTRHLNHPAPSLAAPGFATATLRAFLATRPAFFVASIFPVLVGTAWAGAAHHSFNGLLFGLALVATVLVHAATNVWNDVGDDVIGADTDNTHRIYPYTGGSQFIQSGILSRADMIRLALGLAAGALALGALLAGLRGPGVIVLGIVGLTLGLLYSLPGVQLSARGIGETAVAIGFGALPVLGAEWLQTGFIDAGAVLVCIPVSAWVAAIVVINEVPDIQGDSRVRKRTLVVRFGAPGARWIYGGLTAITLITSLAAVMKHALPAWYTLAAVLLAVAGFWALTGISVAHHGRARLTRSIKLTLTIHALGCVAIIAGILSQHAAG